MVQTPLRLRRTAYFLLTALFVIVILLLFVPWQQTVLGTGRVTSFSPDNRPQTIEAPITGQVRKWHVQEGEVVSRGTLIVELRDLEKDYLPTEVIDLTEQSLAALVQSKQAYLNKADAIASSIQSLKKNLADTVESANQTVKIAKVDRDTAAINLDRINALADEGLSSKRERELAIQAETKSTGELAKAEIELTRSASKLEAEIAKLASERASSLADAAKINDEIAKVDLKVKTARERRVLSEVRAPYDGVVVKLLKRGIGETFKEGEQIAIITPQSIDQAVELFISDIDAPLVSPGSKVRLQFSGWPALQFAGFSDSIRLGTFGGKVTVVDNVDSGGGTYRLLIEADQTESDWPDQRFLRPGTRAAGWIILKTVPLGYELWRRFNGFPIGLPDLAEESGYSIIPEKKEAQSQTNDKTEGYDSKAGNVIYKKRRK